MSVSIISTHIKLNKQKINLLLGEVTNLSQIGQGGNSIVYSGKQNNHEVAIKFLIQEESQKLLRFKAEYFNIIFINNHIDIVKYINYEEYKIEDKLIPIIVMKKYEHSFKEYSKTIEVNYINFIKLR